MHSGNWTELDVSQLELDPEAFLKDTGWLLLVLFVLFLQATTHILLAQR